MPLLIFSIGWHKEIGLFKGLGANNKRFNVPMLLAPNPLDNIYVADNKLKVGDKHARSRDHGHRYHHH